MAAEGELDLDAKMKYKITAIEKRKEIREENISKVLNTTNIKKRRKLFSV